MPLYFNINGLKPNGFSPKTSFSLSQTVCLVSLWGPHFGVFDHMVSRMVIRMVSRMVNRMVKICKISSKKPKNTIFEIYTSNQSLPGCITPRPGRRVQARVAAPPRKHAPRRRVPVIRWSPSAQRRCYPTGRCAYRPSVTS